MSEEVLVQESASYTKGDLLLLMEHICMTDTSVMDYQDAARVRLMRHAFGLAGV